ncbi:hypothetical protein M422DRAFT_261687 [Sphaerobolus stellatus SS14]|uniref:Phosphatidylserine decarboxylase n=1 Tax=Sphaerobolus stellatus (strain SS14) TaxID=990650 RepID=A0A0C9VEV5_SPHS4|nr:hypothetical protein M422DRAFT_261687 [Sphaerobolus stellatus SS14]
MFLAPHDYHCKYALVGGQIVRVNIIPGCCYLQVVAKPDLNTNDSSLKLGMAQVSSGMLQVKASDVIKKGEHISCFQFGGLEVVIVVQKDANVSFTVCAISPTSYNYGNQIAVANADKK